MTAKRIFAFLGAAFIVAALSVPTFAKQVNVDDDPETFGFTNEVGELTWIGEIGRGNSFWALQPYDAYWTEIGGYDLNTPQYERTRMWQLVNSYHSGEVVSIRIYHPKHNKEIDNYSQYAMNSVISVFVWSDGNWELEKQSETTNGSVHEVVYTGKINAGDTIIICGINNRNTRYDADAAKRIPLNDPSYHDDQRRSPSEESALYSNVRPVRKDGQWATDAESFVWEDIAGHDGGSAWIYTAQEEDELIYADCLEKVHYENELRQEDMYVTIRYRFKFEVRDENGGTAGLLGTPPSGQTGTTQDGSTAPEDPLKLDDWGEEPVPPSQPDEPEEPFEWIEPEQENDTGSSNGGSEHSISETGAAVVSTVVGTAIIGAATGAAVSGSGGDGEPEIKELKEIRPAGEKLEEPTRRQEEAQRQIDEERARMEALRQEMLEKAKEQAEKKKRFYDNMFKKYKIDQNQPDAFKKLYREMKKATLDAMADAEKFKAEEAEYKVWEQLATDISNGADISMELAASVTGEVGQAVLAGYYTLKGTATRTGEAISRIAYNGKSYKDYSLGDFAGDAWDLTHSAVQGTAEGASKAVQSFTNYNHPVAAKVKAGLQIGGEAVKEMWDTARNGGDLWDIAKAGAKGTVKGTVNATISYTLDKTVGKLAGKGSTVANTKVNNYGWGWTKGLDNTITSGDLISGSTNAATSFITNKLGLEDKMNSWFGKQTAHAEAAAEAAKKISQTAATAPNT